MEQRRQFKMHPRLLWDVIHRQAGTLSKAILEGVMNCVDAGASRCEVELSQTGFSIRDDGKGFSSDSEIELFFETFGQPHEAGDATYGRFRMGRGQMFAFGVNDWSSNEYRMHIDLKPQGQNKGDDFSLGYDFRKVAESMPGCQITVKLYDPLPATDVERMVQGLGKYVAWAPIPIFLNGKQVNTLPKDSEWDYEDDGVYISFKDRGHLTVYNLGVLVRDYPAAQFGIGGIVVSKTAFDVNFARNDVQSTCPLWRRVGQKVRAEANTRLTGKARLDDVGREALAQQFLAGEIQSDLLCKKRVITDTTGAHHPLNMLQEPYRYGHKLGVAKKGDKIADSAIQSGLAMFLSQETLDRFGANDIPHFISLLKRAASAALARAGDSGHAHWLLSHLDRWQVVKREDLEAVFSSSHSTVSEKDLSAVEKIQLGVLQRGSLEISWALRSLSRDPEMPGVLALLGDRHHMGRKVFVGIADTSDAWTDGSESIWVNRQLLPLVDKGHEGLARLVGILIHEFLHDNSDIESHDHGIEFYKGFHDLIVDSGIIGTVVKALLSDAAQAYRAADKKVPKALAKATSNDDSAGAEPKTAAA